MRLQSQADPHKNTISRNGVKGISTGLHVWKFTLIDRGKSRLESVVPMMPVSLLRLIKRTAILQARLFPILPPNLKSMATKEVLVLADTIY